MTDNPWKDAVIDQLVIHHIYNDTHDSDPRKALQDLLQVNQDIALDPAVSGEAQALIERGRTAAAPPAQPAVPPTDEQILDLWEPRPYGTGTRRPVMGKNKVLSFARKVLALATPPAQGAEPPAVRIVARLLRLHEGRGRHESIRIAEQMLAAESADGV